MQLKEFQLRYLVEFTDHLKEQSRIGWSEHENTQKVLEEISQLTTKLYSQEVDEQYRKP